MSSKDIHKVLSQGVISMAGLSREDVEFVLQEAERCASIGPVLAGRQVALLFYENSTRTYNSFRTAVHKLGGLTCGFAGTGGTSVLKGESLHDTIKMFEAYAEIIVLRHPLDGAAQWASEVSSVPVINAGDGRNQHPTQTLLDLLAIKRTQGRLDQLKVAVVGDLKYGRTVRSLTQALSLFNGIEIRAISPRALRLPKDLVERLHHSGVTLTEGQDLEEALIDADICYVTRIQAERMEDPGEYEKLKGSYQLGASHFARSKPTLKILHPLPRVDEISREVDATQHAHYFEQAAGGVDVRMAILALAEGAERETKASPRLPRPTEASCPNPRCISHPEQAQARLVEHATGLVECRYCEGLFEKEVL